ncbi:MAG TPA: fumarylacetoacetate hydrolase family protein [Ktedonobacteraceae bacterium]|nr:fumarylacetoacetate hydrolase family protein [Ktedonobacteraceae bacterium]
MYLTRHLTPQGPRWARDGHFLNASLNLSFMLTLPQETLFDLLRRLPVEEEAQGELLAPIEPIQEVWASGVTYLRSREARKAESDTADVYEKVYSAARPELFFKASGWRVQGHQQVLHIRKDSQWNVPEPELVLVLNSQMEIVGYCAGNDLSSRSIEGENPLYLPQAKVYDGSCALGPGIVLEAVEQMRMLPITLRIEREEAMVFQETVSVTQMKRSLEELAAYLGRELSFPHGAFLMTGTGIVPPDNFTLAARDRVHIQVGAQHLSNEVI